MKQHYMSTMDKEYADKERWPDLRFHVHCDGSVRVTSSFANVRIPPWKLIDRANNDMKVIADILQGIESGMGSDQRLTIQGLETLGIVELTGAEREEENE